MALTLETLPHDVLFDILCQCSDRSTLTSQIVASRALHKVFKAHKEIIVYEVIWREICASPSAFEADTVAEICDSANMPDERLRRPRVNKAFDNYISCLASSKDRQESEVQALAVDRAHRSHVRSVIVSNHLAVLRACRQCESVSKYPRQLLEAMEGYATPMRKETLKEKYMKNSQPATTSEKNRIIGGFYRLWILISLYGASTLIEATTSEQHSVHPTGGTPLPTDRESHLKPLIKRISELWGFWDSKVVQIVMTTLWERLRLPLHLIRQDMFLSYPHGPDYVFGLGLPFVGYAPEFLLFAITLRSDFANTITSITDPSLVKRRSKELRDAFEREKPSFSKIPSVSQSTEEALLEIGWPHPSWFGLFISTDPPAAYGGDFFSHHPLSQCPASVLDVRRVSLTPDWCAFQHKADALGRYHLSDYDKHMLFREFQSEVGSPRGSTDYWAAVWDDWRLQSWGYHIPNLGQY
ncbi:hypothetical protein TWF696_005609 [Orbilia brochopaga]|uniref:F-box domain-containing protein n=1 Tax=Orbilia brochopaga TaxID=3140254 RepID=A0AAV9V190_9PEZI